MSSHNVETLYQRDANSITVKSDENLQSTLHNADNKKSARKIAKENQEKSFLSYLLGFVNFWKSSSQELGEPSNARRKIRHRRYLVKKKTSTKDLEAKPLRKAVHIVSATVDYGLSNGIIQKDGKYFWFNEPKAAPLLTGKNNNKSPTGSRTLKHIKKEKTNKARLNKNILNNNLNIKKSDEGIVPHRKNVNTCKEMLVDVEKKLKVPRLKGAQVSLKRKHSNSLTRYKSTYKKECRCKLCQEEWKS